MTEFSELAEFVAIPRVSSLELSPDGSWLAATVATLSPDKKKYVSSIWRIDPVDGAPERLTRSAEGESAGPFLSDGSLLFTSARKDPSVKPDDTGDKPALWVLPAGRGEASRIAAPPGGVRAVAAARQAQRYLLSAKAFDGTKDAADDAARRKARADADVNAILHDSAYRVRFWDSDLGPDNVRLYAGEVAASGQQGDDVRDLTPEPGPALDEQAYCLSPDGSQAVTGWNELDGAGGTRSELVVIDVATGERRTLLTTDGHDFDNPVISPDGQFVVATRGRHDAYDAPGDTALVITALAGDGGERVLTAGFDQRPEGAVWSPGSATVYFLADENGRRPVFAVEASGGEVRRVTSDDGAYNNLSVSPDGQAIYALRSAISEPPTPVRIDLAKPFEGPVRLASPTGSLELPGEVREVSTTVADGSTVRAWLVLPDGAGADAKVPLLLWVHGGPVSSWNSWTWRWNWWVAAARGYAVLLPDPALSTGYGHDFIARGYGTWGDKPFTDVMAITDVVTAMPEIDASRTAMMGGSFGGYMANWMAGHTDRFKAIVSHAGLWALDQMFGTTDGPSFWRRQFGSPEEHPERYAANSPHLHVDAISTPVLIIHGDKDYRVPIGEALRMWAELTSRGKDVKFLYFPDENHWILKPGDAVVWYESVFAFLAEHVLGQEWKQPELL